MTVSHPKDVLNTINFVTQCLCIPIISIFVLLRFSIRIYYKQFVGVEDWSCLIAWVLFMGYCGIAIAVGHYGGGYHIDDVSEAHQILFRKFCYIATVLYCPMALFVKIALLSILIRIFSPYRSKIYFIYGLLGCLCIYYIVAEVVKIRMCDPVPGYWTLDPKARCLNQRAALIADSVISVVTDFIILILPLPLTWSLQMSRSKKLRVIGMLSAGGLATAFSLYRLVLVLRDGSSNDQTIVFMIVILSGNAEGGVAMICACLPTINILINKLRKKEYSSQRYYEPESSVNLSKLKGSNKRFSLGNSRRADGTESASDQSHLITFAGTVDMAGNEAGGIHKTVDVSQTIEMVADGDSHESHRHSSFH
ncbi:integral membrane protein [Aspergillus luchuensis IFO 4308]|nr:integral membrane protein [Aspergillus luchuensis IFO 4308]